MYRFCVNFVTRVAIVTATEVFLKLSGRNCAWQTGQRVANKHLIDADSRKSESDRDARKNGRIQAKSSKQDPLNLENFIWKSRDKRLYKSFLQPQKKSDKETQSILRILMKTLRHFQMD